MSDPSKSTHAIQITPPAYLSEQDTIPSNLSIEQTNVLRTLLVPIDNSTNDENDSTQNVSITNSQQEKTVLSLYNEFQRLPLVDYNYFMYARPKDLHETILCLYHLPRYFIISYSSLSIYLSVCLSVFFFFFSLS